MTCAVIISIVVFVQVSEFRCKSEKQVKLFQQIISMDVCVQIGNNSCLKVNEIVDTRICNCHLLFIIKQEATLLFAELFMKIKDYNFRYKHIKTTWRT